MPECVRWLQQEKAHFHHVLHIHEIAHLAAVGVVGVVRFEQHHRARLLNLVEGVHDDRGHAALVVLVGAIHVEKLQSGPEIGLFFLLQGPVVEVVFRVAVGVQRAVEGEQRLVGIGVAQGAVAVGGGRGGVHQRQVVLHAGLPHLLRIVQVEHVEHGRVHLGGIGAGAEVEDELHLLVVGVEPLEKRFPVHVLAQLLALNVGQLLVDGKIIHRHDVVEIGGVEAGN